MSLVSNVVQSQGDMRVQIAVLKQQADHRSLQRSRSNVHTGFPFGSPQRALPPTVLPVDTREGSVRIFEGKDVQD